MRCTALPEKVIKEKGPNTITDTGTVGLFISTSKDPPLSLIYVE